MARSGKAEMGKAVFLLGVHFSLFADPEVRHTDGDVFTKTIPQNFSLSKI